MHIRTTAFIVTICSWVVLVVAGAFMLKIITNLPTKKTPEAPRVAVESREQADVVRAAYEAEKAMAQTIYDEQKSTAMTQALLCVGGGAVLFGSLQFMAGLLAAASSLIARR